MECLLLFLAFQNCIPNVTASTNSICIQNAVSANAIDSENEMIDKQERGERHLIIIYH